MPILHGDSATEPVKFGHDHDQMNKILFLSSEKYKSGVGFRLYLFVFSDLQARLIFADSNLFYK